MKHLWGAPSTTQARATILWRYFPTAWLIQTLSEKTLYFASANQFEDGYEGATRVVSSDLAGFPVGTQAAAFNAFYGNVRQFYKATCWHEANSENALMWQAYASAGKGAAICTDLNRFVEAIQPYRLGQGPLNDVLYCGRVKYIDMTKDEVPTNATPPVGMVKRFFFKHNAFEPEREFRFLADLHHYTGAVSDPKPSASGIAVAVDLERLVEAIVIGPGVSEVDYARLTQAAAMAGLSDRVRDSSLRHRPRFV